MKWLQDNAPDAVLFPIAEGPLTRALREAGLRLSEDPAEIDIVIASYDRGFDASTGSRSTRSGSTSAQSWRRPTPTSTVRSPGGRRELDYAGTVARIDATTGAMCSVNFGKPEPIMAKEALHGLPFDPADPFMVSDRLAAHVAIGILAVMSTALVLTGTAPSPTSQRSRTMLGPLTFLRRSTSSSPRRSGRSVDVARRSRASAYPAPPIGTTLGKVTRT